MYVHCKNKWNITLKYCYIQCMISDFRCEVDENCALLGCYTVSSDNFLPTFRDNLSVPSWRVKNHISTQTHTHTHAYIHTYTHTHTHTYIHTYIHAYIHTYIHTYILYFPAHKTHRDFFFRNFRKNNDECILIWVIYWKKTGLLHTKISSHNMIDSS